MMLREKHIYSTAYISRRRSQNPSQKIHLAERDDLVYATLELLETNQLFLSLTRCMWWHFCIAALMPASEDHNGFYILHDCIDDFRMKVESEPTKCGKVEQVRLRTHIIREIQTTLRDAQTHLISLIREMKNQLVYNSLYKA